MTVEPTYHLRILRLRWRLIATCTVVGLALAVALTLATRDDDVPEIDYFTATHTLIVDPDSAAVNGLPNLLQTALYVTGGTVPDTVADELGREGDGRALSDRVRTVTDVEVSTIDISAVATSAGEAELLASAFADAFVDHLGAEHVASYGAAVDAANDEVAFRTRQIRELDDGIARLERRISVLTDRDPDHGALVGLEDDLRLAQTERAARDQRYGEALAALDALERQGPPQPLMTTQDVVPAFRISASEYERRVAEGRRGDNNFRAGDVDSGSGTRIDIGTTVADPRVRAILGLVAGSLIGVGLALGLDRFDTRLRTRRAVEDAFDVPVLAEIPLLPKRERVRGELHAFSRSRSPVAEAYRMARSGLLFAGSADHEVGATVPGSEVDADAIPVRPRRARASTDHEVRVVMVSSPGPSEGKTTTTANLAVLLAEAGHDVLVVNCDHRLPTLHRYFDVDYVPSSELDTGIDGVTLVADVADEPSDNPTSVVEAQRSLIARARARYDVILLDTAPLLATNDAMSLLPVVDLVLLVAQEGRTDRDAAAETVSLLRRRRAPIAGVVLTASTGFGRTRYYKHYSGYLAHATTADDRRAALGRDRRSRRSSHEAVPQQA